MCTSALGRLIIDKLERASQQNVLSAIILELIKHLLKLQSHYRTGGTSCSLMSSLNVPLIITIIIIIICLCVSARISHIF